MTTGTLAPGRGHAPGRLDLVAALMHFSVPEVAAIVLTVLAVCFVAYLLMSPPLVIVPERATDGERATADAAEVLQ